MLPVTGRHQTLNGDSNVDLKCQSQTLDLNAPCGSLALPKVLKNDLQLLSLKGDILSLLVILSYVGIIKT